MSFSFKSSQLASGISLAAMTVGLGLAVGGPATAQVPPNSAITCFTLGTNGLTAPTPAVPLCINGEGATFPGPLYQGVTGDVNAPPAGAIFNTVGEASGIGYPGGTVPPDSSNPPGPLLPNVRINYSQQGSGAGITAISTAAFTGTGPGSTFITPTISFAGSDALPTDAQLAAYNSGAATRGFGPLVQIPSVGGAITLAFNLPPNSVAPTGIVLNRTQYCGIFTGAITDWSDSRLAGSGYVGGPLPISVVRRADSSGTTQNFTSHLNTVCAGTPTPSPYGVSTLPSWPSSFLSGTGNPGVASLVAATSGGIGYIENATRVSFPAPAGIFVNTIGPDVSLPIRALPQAQIVNQSGNPEFADIPLGGGSTTSAAFNNVTTTRVPCDYSVNPGGLTPRGNNICRLIINQDSYADPTDANAYPIVAVTYLLLYDNYRPSLPRDRNYFGGQGGTIVSSLQTLVSYLYSPAGDATALSRGYAPLSSTIKTQSRGIINLQLRF